MPKQKTSEEAYKECNSKGEFKDQEIVNKDKVKTMLGIAKANIEAAETIKKKLDSKSPQWCAVYTLYYDALRVTV